jgi:2-hydroxychromene-2-carboxylate isomerase
MKTVTWYYDFISPYTYLQAARLDEVAAKAKVTYVPVLFAGLLGHWGTVGPAEVAPKRVNTYRQCLWYGRQHGIPYKMPPNHPFNPINLLRLGVALDQDGPRIRKVFDFIWKEGRDPNEEWDALVAYADVADAAARIGDQAIKDKLRANTEEAAAGGVFGVPSAMVDGELFWGVDDTEFLLAYLDDPGVLDAEMWRISDLPVGQARKR